MQSKRDDRYISFTVSITPKQLMELFEEADKNNDIQRMSDIIDYIIDTYMDENGKMYAKTEDPDNFGMFWVLNTMCAMLNKRTGVVCEVIG